MPFICRKCGAEFEKPLWLNRHGLVCPCRRRYKCPKCSFCYYRLKQIQDHMKSHESQDKSGKQNYIKKCCVSTCGETFDNNDDLKEHLYSSHEIAVIEKDNYFKYVKIPSTPASDIYADSHKQALTIKDEDVKILMSTSWFVRSQKHSTVYYYVRQMAQDCCQDHCYNRCIRPECHLLCDHLFRCNCSEGSTMCEHIHKVNMLLKKNEPPEPIPVVLTKKSNAKERKKLLINECLELTEKLKNCILSSTSVDESLLIKIKSLLKDGVDECQDHEKKLATSEGGECCTVSFITRDEVGVVSKICKVVKNVNSNDPKVDAVSNDGNL